MKGVLLLFYDFDVISFLFTLPIFIFQLMKPDIFDFIEKHNLHDAIREKV